MRDDFFTRLTYLHHPLTIQPFQSHFPNSTPSHVTSPLYPSLFLPLNLFSSFPSLLSSSSISVSPCILFRPRPPFAWTSSSQYLITLQRIPTTGSDGLNPFGDLGDFRIFSHQNQNLR